MDIRRAHWRRNAGLLGFFAALAVLVAAHGALRMDTLQSQRRREVLASVERRFDDLSEDLRAWLSAESRRALHLAPLPALRSALDESVPADDRRRALEGQLAPFLLAFPNVATVRVLDVGTGRAALCERDGEQASVTFGSQPEVQEARELIDAALRDPSALAWTLTLGGRTLRSAARLDSPDGSGTRLLVVAVRADRLVEAARSFEPIPGASCALVEGREPPPASDPSAAIPAPVIEELLVRGFKTLELGPERFFAARLSDAPDLRLLLRAPIAAADAASGSLREEHRWILGTTTAMLLLVAVAGYHVYRRSVRDFELHEMDRFLAQVRRESRKYRAIMEGAADMVLIVDPRSATLRECNSLARDQLGLAAAPEPSGGADPRRDLRRMLAGEGWTAFEGGLRSALEEYPRPAAVRDLRLRARGGAEILADGRFIALDLDDERVVEVALRDVTRERTLERELAAAERLQTIGLLTAGVAHEINNPLAGVGNHLALLEREGLSGDQRRRHLESVKHGFERIRGIVRDLLGLARPGEERGPADVTPAIDHAVQIVRYARDWKDLRVEVRGVDSPCLVRADPGRLEQVLINLLLNAAKAMSGSGTIEVEVRRGGAGGDGEVEIAVLDEGPGIPPEDLPRLFDPFFTRVRAAGSESASASEEPGTGLGLTISNRIVQAYGGVLSAANRADPGGGGKRGARFTIQLPAAEPRTGSTEATAAGGKGAAR